MKSKDENLSAEEEAAVTKDFKNDTKIISEIPMDGIEIEKDKEEMIKLRELAREYKKGCLNVFRETRKEEEEVYCAFRRALLIPIITFHFPVRTKCNEFNFKAEIVNILTSILRKELEMEKEERKDEI